jgi:hypothetical protein
MTNTSPTSALPAELTAEVCANDRIMRYRRSGAGLPILLIFPVPETAHLADELTRALAGNFRLIVPELPASTNATEWLAEFLEGLGTSAVTLIAAGPLCMPAIELALRDDDQISRLVLIPDGDADDAVRDESLITTFGASQVPALIVRPGLGSRETAAVIVRFIEGGSAVGGGAHGNS